MDAFGSSPLNEPLLAGTDDDSDGDEFRDAHSSASSIVSSVSKQQPPLSNLSTSAAAAAHHDSATSYYGTASKLATGSLFPNTQGL
eukprot:scaffold11931_cov75-Skeletonema_dohrnii-CCMP3373.AAC.1